MNRGRLIRSIQNASTNVLDHLLSHDTCDVDPRNRLGGDTPLHIAIRQKWEDHEGLRVYLGMSFAQHNKFFVVSRSDDGWRMNAR